jgi:hypothetical protein
LDTSSVVHESELYEEMLDFSQPFVPHRVVHPKFAFLGVCGVYVDSDDEISVLDCFQKFIDEICGSCLLSKQLHMPTNFWQQILIRNHDPVLEVGCI